MYCSHCGKELRDGSNFCPACGTAVKLPKPVKKSGSKLRILAIVSILVCVVAVVAIVGLMLGDSKDPAPSLDKPGSSSDAEPNGSEETKTSQVETYERPQLLHFSSGSIQSGVTASVAPYSVSAGLSNVINADRFYLSDEQIRLLEENLFVVSSDWTDEFFEVYEYNRYAQIPNFVTVDSLMHTYHLYFSLLLNRTEKNYLAEDLLELSHTMLIHSMKQHDLLVGTNWEEAAARNVGFFAVAASLQDPNTHIPDYVAASVQEELNAIYNAAGIGLSPLACETMDYSQYKPRGYYEGDAVLEQYFRAMMWYGQVNFTQGTETLNRSALLMTLAMEEVALGAWEMIYTITSFFAGSSDDLGYYEYAPAIEYAYGTMPTTEDLVQNEAAYTLFAETVSQLSAPAVNSIPVDENDPDPLKTKKGFRFMGQRFTIDAAVMQQLIYRQVGENSIGQRRMLPDTLDIAAAMGSDLALELLDVQGATDYENYSENMQTLRTALQSVPEDFWATSLYSSWLYTLEPLLNPKGTGYPSFMTSTEWQKKSLETFAGSFTELKHDTVLYSKQVMAEMGGGPMEVLDDRGYVEPEVEVYERFILLAEQTADGLKHYGLVDSTDLENLSRLEQLARKLLVISEKELSNETLTEEEYDLIREYGGTLEHFWAEAVKDKSESEWLDPGEIPSSLVTDIATDPNGTVLQIANGRPAEILVVVPVDGTLRLASGTVFDFYQFEQPITNRLTNTEWRQMIGQWAYPDGTWGRSDQVIKPWWTESYWS